LDIELPDSCTFTADNRFLIATSSRKTLKIWALKTQSLLFDLEGVESEFQMTNDNRIFSFDSATFQPLIFKLCNI